MVVRYPLIGSDLNNALIRVQGKVATEMWSMETAREEDPETRDPEREKDRVMSEKFTKLAFALLEQGVTQGQFTIDDLAEVEEKVRTDKLEVLPAVRLAHRLAQERQAQAVPPTAPEAQPGMAAPGMGAEAGAPIPQGPPGLQNLAATLSQLRPAA